MRQATIIIRVISGLAFLIFGLNGFLGFLPQPPASAEAGAFLGALGATGYMFPLIKGIEVLVGLALLSGVLVPLALTIVAPILVNIVALHLVLDPAGLTLGLVLSALVAFLAWRYRDAYRALFVPRMAPTPSASSPAIAIPAAQPAT